MINKILSFMLIGGLIAFTTYQVIALVKSIIERKKAKSIEKEQNKDGNSNTNN